VRRDRVAGAGRAVTFALVWAILRRRTGDSTIESLRRYSYNSLVWTLVTVAAVLCLALVRNGPQDWRMVPPLVGIAGVGWSQWRWTLRSINGPVGEMSRWLAAALLLACGVLTLVTALWVEGSPVWGIVVGVLLNDVVVGRRIEPAWHLGLPACLAVGLTVVCAQVGHGVATGEALRTAAFTMAITGVMVYTENLLLRQWHLTSELDRARQDAAELATTRERLRLAEDLHDILGHALEVVSLKAELANRLRADDPERAGAELTEVQRLARGALTDVRELVAGRRSTTLPAELAGARTLLGSAGIAWEQTGDPAVAEGAVSELLGRVVREAMTNLLRHANASRCAVTVAGTAESVSVRVVNDGVAPMPHRESAGTGLAGLSRRVTAAGGTFSAGPGADPAEFEVYAEVPR
jgi:two-component system, NarL family, sensor histidine kinase DesK